MIVSEEEIKGRYFVKSSSIQDTWGSVLQATHNTEAYRQIVTGEIRIADEDRVTEEVAKGTWMENHEKEKRYRMTIQRELDIVKLTHPLELGLNQNIQSKKLVDIIHAFYVVTKVRLFDQVGQSRFLYEPSM